jgi:hypothetical protein
MTRLALDRRDRRVLATGILTIGAIISASHGIPAWLAWQREARASAMEVETELAHARAGAAARKVVHDSLAARGQRLLALAPALLSGDSPSSAAATLAGLLSGAAAQASVRLGAVQVRPDSVYRGAFTRVAVRANATGDINGVTQMLLALERGPTLLAIRELSITQPEPGASADRAEALRLELLVEGLMLNPKPGSVK